MQLCSKYYILFSFVIILQLYNDTNNFSYEKSGTHHFEVPRMLFDELDMLESYIMNSKDRFVLKISNFLV